MHLLNLAFGIKIARERLVYFLGHAYCRTIRSCSPSSKSAFVLGSSGKAPSAWGNDKQYYPDETDVNTCSLMGAHGILVLCVCTGLLAGRHS